jgi:hypothetical protein
MAGGGGFKSSVGRLWVAKDETSNERNLEAKLDSETGVSSGTEEETGVDAETVSADISSASEKISGSSSAG